MGFVAALDKACRDFVNRNAATGTSTTKSPELLAKHADALLRKNNKLAEEGELEEALNQTVFFRDFKLIISCLTTLKDDFVQIHRRQGCLPDLLHYEIVKAPHSRSISLRRSRGEHDLKAQRRLWFRIYQ
jgi:hypothetical protein